MRHKTCLSVKITKKEISIYLNLDTDESLSRSKENGI